MTESKPQWEISAIKAEFSLDNLVKLPAMTYVLIWYHLYFFIACLITLDVLNFELVSLINSTSGLFIGPSCLKGLLYRSFVRISYSRYVRKEFVTNFNKWCLGIDGALCYDNAQNFLQCLMQF